MVPMNNELHISKKPEVADCVQNDVKVGYERSSNKSTLIELEKAHENDTSWRVKQDMCALKKG